MRSALVVLVLAGLGSAATPWPAAAAAAPASATAELVVFEAASLKDAFGHLALVFEKEHPGTKVVVNAAGSQELRAQIEHGAATDVFASADRKHMDALEGGGLVERSVVFTCNEPVVVVRAGLVGTIQTLADLPRAERIVVGAPEVPIGAYTLQILKKAEGRFGAGFAGRVDARVVSRELNVRQVLAKVVLGEADAGVVYRSDAITAKDKVRVLPIPPELNVTARYPIAALKKAPSPGLARQWIALVTSAAGAAALRDAGFMPCPPP
jgi:molybdate transport system substrate-binding protein